MKISTPPDAYRIANMSAAQRCLALAAILVMLNCFTGLMVWTGPLCVDLIVMVRNYKSGRSLRWLIESLQHFLHSWKSTLPLISSMYAFYWIPQRTRHAANTLLATLLFLVVFACYDIYFDHWDMVEFGANPRKFFFNWWWYQ